MTQIRLGLLRVIFYLALAFSFFVAERIEETWKKFNLRINGLRHSGSVRVLSRGRFSGIGTFGYSDFLHFLINQTGFWNLELNLYFFFVSELNLMLSEYQ